MNKSFSLQRFSRLFVKHTIEHSRTYLMSIAVLTGVLVLGGAFLFFVFPEPPDPGFQTAVFFMLLLLAGTIFTSTVFSDFGDRRKAVAAIMLPATNLEKFLVGWIYSFPIFVLVYTGVFYLALWGLGSMVPQKGNVPFMFFRPELRDCLIVAIIYSILHGIALFGAIFFQKLHFIKTAFAFFIGFALLMFLNTLFLKLITGLNWLKASIPFGFLNFQVDNRFYSVALQGPMALVILLVLFGVAILIWVAAFYRLKEKQV